MKGDQGRELSPMSVVAEGLGDAIFDQRLGTASGTAALVEKDGALLPTSWRAEDGGRGHRPGAGSRGRFSPVLACQGGLAEGWPTRTRMIVAEGAGFGGRNLRETGQPCDPHVLLRFPWKMAGSCCADGEMIAGISGSAI